MHPFHRRDARPAPACLNGGAGGVHMGTSKKPSGARHRRAARGFETLLDIFHIDELQRDLWRKKRLGRSKGSKSPAVTDRKAALKSALVLLGEPNLSAPKIVEKLKAVRAELYEQKNWYAALAARAGPQARKGDDPEKMDAYYQDVCDAYNDICKGLDAYSRAAAWTLYRDIVAVQKCIWEKKQ
jgi:hypothetical protein